MKREKSKKLIQLFLVFLKIGAFTFGGGYAMIALIEREMVERKKWLEQDECLDMVAIAESTPGPIAVNAATYVGYKLGGFFGALISTIAVCMPSFVIIYIISLFFDKFLENRYITAAFRGIQACVCYLILSAGIKLFSAMKHDAFNVVLLIGAIIVMLFITLLSVNFSSIILILIGALIGICFWLLKRISDKGKERKV